MTSKDKGGSANAVPPTDHRGGKAKDTGVKTKAKGKGKGKGGPNAVPPSDHRGG